jgi:hypothetical protein
LPQIYIEKAYDWLGQKYTNLIPYLAKFAAKDDIFPKFMFNDEDKKLSAHKCVMSSHLESNTEFYKASIFFSKIHSIPACSATLERFFFTYGMVWTKFRNKVGADKAQNLETIHRELNKFKS